MLLTAGVSALILVTTLGGNEYAWGSSAIVGLAAVSLVLLVAFVRHEHAAAEPIIPLTLFRSPVFRVASGMAFLIGLALFGAIFASRLGSELVSLPATVAARFSGGVNVSPDEVHALAPAVRHDFLEALVHALQPVFLVGAGLAAVAFVLSWMLREVPLRATAARSPTPDVRADPATVA